MFREVTICDISVSYRRYYINCITSSYHTFEKRMIHTTILTVANLNDLENAKDYQAANSLQINNYKKKHKYVLYLSEEDIVLNILVFITVESL